MREVTATADLQSHVDKLLKRGVIFSILWLMGLGSAMSIMAAIKAKRLIKYSDATLTGMGRVWWCFVVGSLGIIIWGTVITIGIVNNLR